MQFHSLRATYLTSVAQTRKKIADMKFGRNCAATYSPLTTGDSATSGRSMVASNYAVVGARRYVRTNNNHSRSKLSDMPLFQFP
jgi:hypothetical protein